MYENLSLSRFQINFMSKGSIRLPHFPGSAFRGVLGHALKDVRYGSKPVCSQCPNRSECRYSNLYAYLFQAPADHPLVAPNLPAIGKQVRDLPPPFLIDPPAGGLYNEGDIIPFSMTLVGEAIRFLPFMVCGLENIRHRSMGSGQDRGRLVMVSIFDGLGRSPEQLPLYPPNKDPVCEPARVLNFQTITQHLETCFQEEPFPDRIQIHFQTPFRFKFQGRLGVEPDFHILMKNLMRRLHLLSVHSPMKEKIDFSEIVHRAKSIKTLESRLKWVDLDRYSNRQKGKMTFGGFVGSIEFSGNLKEFLPFLTMGQFVNIGKACTFGLGKYTCQNGNGHSKKEIFHVSF